MLHCCRCYAVYACQRIFTVENKMAWWRRKKLKIETLWFRTTKFFYSSQANNYKKANYFSNASMVNVKEANRKCKFRLQYFVQSCCTYSFRVSACACRVATSSRGFFRSRSVIVGEMRVREGGRKKYFFPPKYLTLTV